MLATPGVSRDSDPIPAVARLGSIERNPKTDGAGEWHRIGTLDDKGVRLLFPLKRPGMAKKRHGLDGAGDQSGSRAERGDFQFRARAGDRQAPSVERMVLAHGEAKIRR